MKYFAVAVIFGLFALSQAMPVDEPKEKRFNPILIGAVNLAKGACNSIEQSGNAVDPLISKVCGCIKAAGGIIGIFGDESNSEEKRIFWPIKFDLNALIEQVSNIINSVCANAPPEFADMCQCIKF